MRHTRGQSMSSGQAIVEADPEEVTKGQLLECMRGMQARLEKVEEENDELREHLQKRDDNMVTKTAGNHVIGSLLGVDEQDFNDDIFQHKQAAEDFHERFTDVANTVKQHQSKIEKEGTATGDTKEKAWQEVVDKAENLSSHRDHSLPDNRVLLYAKEIETATGYSNRRACQLIEEWGQEKEGADWRPYERGSAGTKSNSKKKALKINLDVWGSDDE